MASLNKIFLLGNLTRDTELRYLPSGSAVCEFGLAVNRRYTANNGQERDETCFIDVSVWGKQAETCDRYLQKGSSLLVEGRLQMDQWQDRETGKTRSKLKVIAERTQFIGGRPQGGQGGQADQNNSQFQPNSFYNDGDDQYGDDSYQQNTSQQWSAPPNNTYVRNNDHQPQPVQRQAAPPMGGAGAPPAPQPPPAPPISPSQPPQHQLNNNAFQNPPPQMPNDAFQVDEPEDDIPF